MLNSEEFLLFLIDELSKKYKYSEEDATELAETLIVGAKKVKEGDYAIISGDNLDLIFFMRQNDKWVRDDVTNNNSTLQTKSENLCNIQENCIYSDGKNGSFCDSLGLNKSIL